MIVRLIDVLLGSLHELVDSSIVELVDILVDTIQLNVTDLLEFHRQHHTIVAACLLDQLLHKVRFVHVV